MTLRLVLVVASVLAVPAVLGAQATGQPIDTSTVPVAADDLRDAARAAQARFERRRIRYLPVSLWSGSGSCDERVGRFCTWYEEGEWFPVPERREIRELRAELLAVLDSAGLRMQGDAWIIGQRVWYRSEAGDWSGAHEAARACRAEPWWCAALQGFALHGLGRYGEAERAFEAALRGMDGDRARSWQVPRRPLDSDARRYLERAESEGPGELNQALERLWTLADPLYLVPGNDRKTAHFARWTVAAVRDEARNPFLIRWGDDLEELTVRHGWELGWERAPLRGAGAEEHVVGHKHPEGRDFMPPGRALADLEAVAPGDLVADRSRPRSLYAPGYAPVLLPMHGQVAVFPRDGRMAIVATQYLPEDTTIHAGHGHALPWMEPGAQAGLPDRVGLYALPVAGGRARERRVLGRADGVLMLEVPAGSYLVSSESWSPGRRRAGRLRLTVARDTVLPDIAVLSDVLILVPRGSAAAPTTLIDVLPRALRRAAIRPGQTFAIGWEVAGLGFRPETLRFSVSIERTDRGALRRVGEFLRLTERPRPLALSWEEPGPTVPGPHFRHLDLELPDLDPGRYEVRLTLRTSGRSDVVSVRRFSVEER